MSSGDQRNHRTLEVSAATSFALARLQLGPLYHNPEYSNDGYYYEFPRDMHTDGLLIRLARWLVFLAKLLCLVSLSAVSYAMFYQSSMPAQHVIKELHFDYIAAGMESATDHTSVTLTRNVGHLPHWVTPGPAGLMSGVQAKHRAIPTATLNLLARHNEWHAYFDEIVPQSSKQYKRVLEEKQAYFIEVALKLPESKSNIDAGMFGVETELYTSVDESAKSSSGTCPANGKDNSLLLLARSRRSYRFPHRSSWISTIAKIALLVPLLVGAFEEAQTVASPAFRHYIESQKHPLQFVKVKILQHDAATPVEAIGGVLRIGEEFSQFQEMLRTWFFTSAFVGTLFFCVFYYVLYRLSWYTWTTSMERLKHATEMDEPTCELNLDEDLDDDLFEDCNQAEGMMRATGHNQDNDFTNGRMGDTTMESNSAYADMAPATSANDRRPNGAVEREMESEDEWEDLPIDVSIQSDGIQAASPLTVPQGRVDGGQSFRPRAITGEELNVHLFNRLRSASESPKVDSTADSIDTVSPPVDIFARRTEDQRCNPFLFFFN